LKYKPIITAGTLIKGGTGINIVPDYCEATVDIRLIPKQTKEKVKTQITNLIEKLKQKDPQIQVEIQGPHFFITKGIPTICGFGPDGENQWFWMFSERNQHIIKNYVIIRMDEKLAKDIINFLK
jgi:acetylornithine deacetylase/succinyl-diaminopimelate desuccinylase-like protein